MRQGDIKVERAFFFSPPTCFSFNYQGLAMNSEWDKQGDTELLTMGF